MAFVDKLVLLPRLTEVRALVGFTRFESKGSDIDGELDIGAEVARIDDPMTWLPAVENSGEGFFFSLSEGALTKWAQLGPVVERDNLFTEGFKVWQAQREDRKKSRNDFARARYVLLHSLSHLLITAVSLECGYAASSILRAHLRRCWWVRYPSVYGITGCRRLARWPRRGRTSA